eukprot:s6946_g2.t1
MTSQTQAEKEVADMFANAMPALSAAKSAGREDTQQGPVKFHKTGQQKGFRGKGFGGRRQQNAAQWTDNQPQMELTEETMMELMTILTRLAAYQADSYALSGYGRGPVNHSQPLSGGALHIASSAAPWVTLAGETRRAVSICFDDGPVAFNAQQLLHCAEDSQDRRVICVAYCLRGIERLSAEQYSTLCDLGFNRGDELGDRLLHGLLDFERAFPDYRDVHCLS